MSEDLDKLSEKIRNRALQTFNLDEYIHPGERVVYDIADNLFQGMILREKDIREFVKDHDWAQYKGKNIAIICSADAVIQQWAYMLLAVRFEEFAHMVVLGDLEQLERKLFDEALGNINPEDFRDAKLVIKGCGEKEVPAYAYVEITRLLKPYVFSLFYGEPCSTVPLYKKKKV